MMKRLLTLLLLALAVAAPMALAEFAADAHVCLHPAVTQALS
jgi:Ni/Co efflux regulator RcnB